MQKGDVGTVIALDTSIDISTASTAEIKYKKPSGATGTWVGSASDTEVQYTTISGDINEVGIWSLQAHVVLAAWNGYSSIVDVTVGEQILI